MVAVEGEAFIGELIAEFDDLRVLDGLRGKRPWDRAALAAILVSAGTLAASGRDWIDTFDINPLIYGPASSCAGVLVASMTALAPRGAASRPAPHRVPLLALR